MEFPTRRGFSISYRGKTLLSRFDPVAQGERLAAEVPIKERTLYFCPSPIYGYGLPLFLQRLRQEGAQNNSAILCVEADEKLFEITKKALAENSFPAALTNAKSPEEICDFVRQTWGERQFRRLETIRLSAGWQLYPQLYQDMEGALGRELALEWGNAMTLIRLGRLYTRNLIRNLALLPQSESLSSFGFSSSPVLVLGAGPSLDPLLDELSAFYGGAVPAPEERPFKIICVDSCLHCLIEREILPDLVVILESQHWNLRDFIGIRGRKINAALDLSSLPASARVLAGRRFFFATPWTNLALFRRLGEAGILPELSPPMGSVALSAVALALRGGGPVLVSGMDFAYSLDASHALSSPSQAEQAMRQTRLRSIINAAATLREGSFSILSEAGKKLRSDPGMRRYRQLFEQEFAANSRLQGIDGQGLPLGLKTVSPAEALAILNSAGTSAGGGQGSEAGAAGEIPQQKIVDFIRREIDSLNTLKDMLSGAVPPEPSLLEQLIDNCDYLWAHFPECAGKGQGGDSKAESRRPPLTDLSFLKRLRMEIEPFHKCWEMALGELGDY